MKNFNELVARNYHAVVKRGQINPDTTDFQFIEKMREELEEIGIARVYDINEFDFISEVVDLMSVCTSLLKHKGYDIVNIFEEKATLKNEWRAENE